MVRRFIAALAAVLATALPAHATTFSTDFTDMWWNSAEDGWGLNIIQQGDTLFATFFVYGSDRSPRWYVAPNNGQTQVVGSTRVFGGKVYETTGPWFGGAYTPAASSTEVGNITLSFASPGTLSLTYNINSTSVTKNLTRLGFRLSSPAGRYLGGITFSKSPCTNPNLQGNGYLAGIVTTTQNGTTVSFRVDESSGAVCTFTGTIVQQGRLSSVPAGTWSCVAGTTVTNQGTFALTEIDVQVNGFNGAWSATDQACQYVGRFGGARDVVN